MINLTAVSSDESTTLILWFPHYPLLIITLSPGKINSSIKVQLLRAFFQNTKSSLTKHKKCLLEASYETSEISKFELFRNKVNGL